MTAARITFESACNDCTHRRTHDNARAAPTRRMGPRNHLRPLRPSWPTGTDGTAHEHPKETTMPRRYEQGYATLITQHQHDEHQDDEQAADGDD